MSTTQPIVFDDVSTKQGICQDIDFICGTTLTQFPKADKVRSVNIGLDSVADLIQKVSDEWSWDDLGQTTLPIGYIDTVASTQTVSIDTSFLNIRGVYINDGSENYTALEPVSEAEVLTTKDTGTPTGYCLIGNKIFLTPIPNTSTSGNSVSKTGYAIKVQFERAVKYFASDATTATVGYNPQYTRLATLYACKDYAIAKGKENLNAILGEILKIETALRSSYARRNKTKQRRMIPMRQNNR